VVRLVGALLYLAPVIPGAGNAADIRRVLAAQRSVDEAQIKDPAALARRGQASQ